MKPLILLNFKTYPEALGSKGVALARKIAQVKTRKYQIVIAPTLSRIQEVVKAVSVSNAVPSLASRSSVAVFAQHADPVESGAHTGSISVAELKQIGVKGTLLNHSERKVALPVLGKTIALCRCYGITTVACASSLAEVKKVAAFKPHYIAYEPPELIGGDISVTKAKPEIIARAVQAAAAFSVPVLCGAGIQNKEDIVQALKLGARGVLIGHAVCKAKEPKRFLERMLG